MYGDWFSIDHVTWWSTLQVAVVTLGRNVSTFKSRDRFRTNHHTFSDLTNEIHVLMK